MEVIAERKVCANPNGCDTKLASDNENLLCGPCLRKWREEEDDLPPQRAETRGEKRKRPRVEKTKRLEREANFPDSPPVCPEGHELFRTGYTLTGRCFECRYLEALKRDKPKMRYYYLPNLHKFLNGDSVRAVHQVSGVPRHAISEYLRGANRAPQRNVQKLARALGVSVEALKGAA